MSKNGNGWHRGGRNERVWEMVRERDKASRRGWRLEWENEENEGDFE